MKIAVAGLWHLGSVTAACLAEAGHEVIAFDSDSDRISALKSNKAPVYEPGLDELIAKGQTSGKLQFTNIPNTISEAEIIWVTFDTPVDDNDIADIAAVTQEVRELFQHLRANSLLLISSQIPVGTTRQLWEQCKQVLPNKNISFACSPENLRLGNAIHVFSRPDRIVMGIENDYDKQRIEKLLLPITSSIVWMSIESAEMTKHALNSFLAASVVFINELSVLCESTGADARDVERGLKSEERIGPKAYLRPGGAIAGGTLARDVNYLTDLGKKHQIKTPFFSSILKSNQQHRQWYCKRILEILGNLENKNIAALGLTYKAGTDTLRRSSSIETCTWLSKQGANVSVYDPVVKILPKQLRTFIQLKTSLEEALQDADAILITTEWPQFSSLTIEKFLALVKQPFLFDANGFLMKPFGQDNRIHYFSVGSTT